MNATPVVETARGVLELVWGDPVGVAEEMFRRKGLGPLAYWLLEGDTGLGFPSNGAVDRTVEAFLQTCQYLNVRPGRIYILVRAFFRKIAMPTDCGIVTNSKGLRFGPTIVYMPFRDPLRSLLSS